MRLVECLTFLATRQVTAPAMVGKYNVEYGAWIAVATLGAVVIMTLMHLTRDINSQEEAARLRAELMAKAEAPPAERHAGQTHLPETLTRRWHSA